MAKNPKMVKCRNCDTTIAANSRICPACGAKNKKPFYKRGWFIFLVILAVLNFITIISQRNAEKAEQTKEYRWPDSKLAAMIPQPDSKYGKIGTDSESSFWIEVYGISEEQFEDYIDACKECGFTVDYSRYGGSYSADNEKGYSLSLSYYDDDEELRISLYAPAEQDDEEVGDSDRRESEQGSSVEQGSGADDSDLEHNGESQEDGEGLAQESDAENQESDTENQDGTDSTSTEESSADELVDGMRPEFKEAMDSYEAFYDEYCDLMKEYTKNPTDITILKYTDLLSSMQEMDEKFEAWEDGDMNDAELKYYLEVHSRISQKMLEISTEQ